MKRVIGYENGRAIWSENVPSSPGLSKGYGGDLVRGGPGPVEAQRLAERAHKAKLKAAKP